MLPKSDELEALYERAKRLSSALGKKKSAEVTQQATKDEIGAVARAWLGFSPTIREVGCCNPETLKQFDDLMSDLLTSSSSRARASTYKNKLAPFVDDAVDAVIVPVIQVEGSPRQVAARQVEEAFRGATGDEEEVYVREAARCVTVECYRAAIIMIWAAGVARMHAAVMNRGFADYNSAVDSLAAKKGAPFNRIKQSAKITSLPELQRARDADLLIVGMELFGYDLQTYQELDRLLGLRNDCAHPGMNHPGALDVQQYATKARSLIFDKVLP